MRRRACTDLSGGRSVMSVPTGTATFGHTSRDRKLGVFFLFPSLSSWLWLMCAGLTLILACRYVEVGRIDGRRREIGSRDLRLHQYGIRCWCLACVLILIRWRSLLLLFAETAKARNVAGEGRSHSLFCHVAAARSCGSRGCGRFGCSRKRLAVQGGAHAHHLHDWHAIQLLHLFGHVAKSCAGPGILCQHLAKVVAQPLARIGHLSRHAPVEVTHLIVAGNCRDHPHVVGDSHGTGLLGLLSSSGGSGSQI